MARFFRKMIQTKIKMAFNIIKNGKVSDNKLTHGEISGEIRAFRKVPDRSARIKR